jgi:hypothetical protein
MRMSSFRRGFLSGLWVSLIGVGCSTGLAWFFEQAEMETCMSGLLEARGSFDQYRGKHAGHFPQRLDELDHSTAAPDAFRCPKAKRLGTHAYLYIQPSNGAPDDTPILLCWRHPQLLALTKGRWIRRWTR